MNNHFPVLKITCAAKKTAIQLSCFVLFLCCFVHAYAQSPVFEKTGFENGLPEEHIKFTFRDSRGMVWVGGTNGLYRYDGYAFRAYRNNPADTHSLCNNNINHIAEDARGRIWIGTDNGLCFFERQTNRFTTLRVFENGTAISAVPFTRLFVDANQIIWAGTFRKGVFAFDENGKLVNQIRFTEEEVLSRGNEITGIQFEPGGSLWVTTLFGLYRVQPQGRNYMQFTLDKHLPGGKNFQNLFTAQPKPDPKNKRLLWISTWGDGLAAFDQELQQFTTYLPFPEKHPAGTTNIITDFLFADDTTILACCEKGLLRFDTRTHRFTLSGRIPGAAYSLGAEFPTRIHRDREGIVWLSTSEGLYRINPLLQAFHYNEILATEKRMGPVCMENDSTFWYATMFENRRLVSLNLKNNAMQTIPMPELDAGNIEVMDMAFDASGTLWLATTRGIFSLKRNARKPERALVHSDKNHPGNFIYTSMIEVMNRNLFFGTQVSGLVMYDCDEKKFTHFTKATTRGFLNDSSCVWLSTGEPGTLWMTGKYTGMMKLQHGRFTPLPMPDAFRLRHFGYEMSDIRYRKGDGLFIASRSRSVTRLNPEKKIGQEEPVHFDARKNMHISLVYSICLDALNTLWVGGYGDIYRITGDSVHYIEELGKLLRKDVVSLEYIAANKTVFAVGPNVFLKTDFDYKLPQQLDVFIDRYTIRDSVIVCAQNPGPLLLAHDQNAFRFEFAAPDYFHPKAIRYRYKLQGHDPYWTDAGETRTLNYANIPPGEYVLYIEAWDSESPGRKVVFKLPVKIVPAFYQTLWFKTLMVLLVFAIVFGLFYIFRVQRLKVKLAELEKEQASQRIREAISADIHDEIGAGLTLISLQGQSSLRHFETDAQKTKTVMQGMIKNAQLLAQSLGEIVWSVNPKYDTLHHFLAFIRNYCHNFLEESGFAYEVNVDDSLADIKLSPEVRRNLLMIVKEALNNATKYSNGNHIVIAFGKNNGTYFLSVEDNGTVFQPSETRTGNGIPGMRTRAAKAGWEIDITFTAGQGVRVYAAGPLR